ncbi:HAD family hydrolase [Methanobrevibacter filiformis]|uniref:Putative copper-importing P-type ATPase A n=1 Tax=Methanobrevibacter filiformis TaxID=55758 RepID=A0A166AUM0_9EURY|nr:HAD family hydrolase [Methanobrevibacter filiformis]KZX12492.1 putative copper-importing P-type ATPase A [Methanobrevibacter filiformis]
MTKKAIVFDVSGTLIKRYGNILSVDTGENLKKSTLDVIDELGHVVLVVLQTNTKKTVMEANPNETLYDFLNNKDIAINISYSSSNIGLDDLIAKLKCDKVTLSYFQESAKYLTKEYGSLEICSGSAFIYNTKENRIQYTITAGGKIFQNTSKVIDTLNKRGINSFIASGDRINSLYDLGQKINIPKANIFDTVNEYGKEKIVEDFQLKGFKVMMVGNGSNDVLAFKKSDLSVLTTEQGEFIRKDLFNEVDVVVDHIIDILDIDF